MSSATPGPRCPRCHRPIAAWRLEYCLYCGETFPADLKEGFSEPDALKWVQRPAIPVDAAKQLEMMKVLPWEQKKSTRSRSMLLAAGAISVVAFAVVFVLLYLILRRSMPSFGALVLAIGGGFVGYLVWVFLRAYRRGGT
jgi:undecaprenyl pyrophosphate phosphatase UppP